MTKALIILVVLTSLSSLSYAQQPIEALQKSIDQSINIYYLSRLQESYNNESVTLMGQNMISRTKAVVQANVRWQNKDVPLEIKMLKRGDSWKVY